MTCKPTQTPAADTFDIPTLREKYRAERDKRMRADREGQYQPTTDDTTHSYDAVSYTHLTLPTTPYV